MSYEPRIYIRKKDLEKNRACIEVGQYNTPPNIKSKKKIEKLEGLHKAYKELDVALNQGTIKFPEIELVAICPDGTTHNANVRNLLDTLEIDYRVE